MRGGGVLAEQRRVAKYCGGKICQQAVLSPIRQVYSSVTALNSPLITKSHLFRPFMPLKATPSIFGQSCVDRCHKFCFVIIIARCTIRKCQQETWWVKTLHWRGLVVSCPTRFWLLGDLPRNPQKDDSSLLQWVLTLCWTNKYMMQSLQWTFTCLGYLDFSSAF